MPTQLDNKFDKVEFDTVSLLKMKDFGCANLFFLVWIIYLNR